MTHVRPGESPAEVTRVYERFGCLFVEGIVVTTQGPIRSEFTIPKVEVSHMDRDAFHAFAVRQLPLTTIDKKWSPTGEVLV